MPRKGSASCALNNPNACAFALVGAALLAFSVLVRCQVLFAWVKRLLLCFRAAPVKKTHNGVSCLWALKAHS